MLKTTKLTIRIDMLRAAYRYKKVFQISIILQNTSLTTIFLFHAMSLNAWPPFHASFIAACMMSRMLNVLEPFVIQDIDNFLGFPRRKTNTNLMKDILPSISKISKGSMNLTEAPFAMRGSAKQDKALDA